jgi:transcriptional regulator with XRE-family HTH domain
VIVSKAWVGAGVAHRREAAGLSVAALAARAELDEAVVSAIERGERRVSSRELQAVAEALGVEELELLSRPAPGYLILPGVSPPRRKR